MALDAWRNALAGRLYPVGGIVAGLVGLVGVWQALTYGRVLWVLVALVITSLFFVGVIVLEQRWPQKSLEWGAGIGVFVLWLLLVGGLFGRGKLAIGSLSGRVHGGGASPSVSLFPSASKTSSSSSS